MICSNQEEIPWGVKRQTSDWGSLLYTFVGFLDGGFRIFKETDTEIRAAWGQNGVRGVEI